MDVRVSNTSDGKYVARVYDPETALHLSRTADTHGDALADLNAAVEAARHQVRAYLSLSHVERVQYLASMHAEWMQSDDQYVANGARIMHEELVEAETTWTHEQFAALVADMANTTVPL